MQLKSTRQTKFLFSVFRIKKSWSDQQNFFIWLSRFSHGNHSGFCSFASINLFNFEKIAPFYSFEFENRIFRQFADKKPFASFFVCQIGNLPAPASIIKPPAAVL